MIILFFSFLFGSVVGSFLNVCICRLPENQSIVFPSSHCPRCKHKLTGLDLIPIFSYFLRRGKCVYCGQPFSARYPLVEFLSGLIFMGTAYFYPPTLVPFDFIFYTLLLSTLLVIAFIDLERQVIPDMGSFLVAGLGLFYNLFRQGNFFSSLMGAALGYGLFYLIGLLGKWFFKKEAIGEGDLFLSGALGAVLGWSGLLLAIFLAYLLSAVLLSFLLLLRKVKMGDYVPFGPALVAGAILALFFKASIFQWYFSFLFAG